MTLVDDLVLLRSQITPETWGKWHGNPKMGNGRTCLAVHASRLFKEDFRFHRITDAIRGGGEIHRDIGIGEWNDAPSTTIETIWSAIDKAIAKYT